MLSVQNAFQNMTMGLVSKALNIFDNRIKITDDELVPGDSVVIKQTYIRPIEHEGMDIPQKIIVETKYRLPKNTPLIPKLGKMTIIKE